MRKLARTHSKITKEALVLFGLQVKQARKQLRFSESDLAERMGVSRTTLQKIERGDPFVAIGLSFEAAVLVGIPLFEIPGSSLGGRIERVHDKLALLPKKIRGPSGEIDDDF